MSTLTPAFNPDLAERIAGCGIIAVLVIDDAELAVPLARTLLDNGVSVMELTLRTPAALEALRRIHVELPEMIAGAGTVLSPSQVDDVCQAGAAFAVAPGLNRRVVEYARQVGISFAPGVMTPSDIEAGIELGCRVLKFFPAESSGGPKHLKSMAAAYQHLGLSFIPLGGISAENMQSYLQCPLVTAIGGSWIAKRETIAARDWDSIGKYAAEARAISNKIKA
jgi:2-dehydro-3-deoxyphosphogluconate aldolase/(4S)-4-hydroxy-2-oxoglutarate aldolase